jgi:nitroreductase
MNRSVCGEAAMGFETGYRVDFGNRDPAEGISELFYRRWSPRSFRKIEIPVQIQEIIFDAARWAPSCFNEQPWFIVTSSGEEDFPVFLDLLVEKNRLWAVNAALLGFVFARRTFSRNGKPNRWARFDTGSAWMSIALQSSVLGLYAHGMAGIRSDEVYGAMGVPEDEYEVMCGFAIGAIDSPEHLLEEFRSMEIPSARRPLTEIWRRGI